MDGNEWVFVNGILYVIIGDVVVDFFGWGKFLFFFVVEGRSGNVFGDINVLGDLWDFFKWVLDIIVDIV